MQDSLKQSILKFFPDFKSIEVYPIFNLDKDILGWNAIAYTNMMYPISGGTHVNQDTAIQICISELFERSYFLNLSRSTTCKDFLINEYPTTCGFAFGFDNQKSKFRSFCEALERWTWSKWIDDHYQMEKVSMIVEKDPLTSQLLDTFSDYACYEKRFTINGVQLKVSIFLGFLNCGVFAGSRCCHLEQNSWRHSVIEAHRNYRNSLLENVSHQNLKKSIIRDRVLYFAENKDVAMGQVERATKLDWPQPVARLIRRVEDTEEGHFLWRTILHDWTPWHLGDEKRFVY